LKRKTTVKILLVGAAVILLALLLTFALNHRSEPKAPQKPDSPDKTDAELSINSFHHTATKDGKTEWTLDAGSASFFSDSNRVRLSDIRMVFPKRSERSEIQLRADHGILDINTHDMEISGNIIVKNRRYRLQTEILHYSHESHIISTNKPVNILGPAIQLKADTMTVDLTRGRLDCKGHVKGTIRGTEFFKTID